MLHEFKLGHNAMEAGKNICCVIGEEAVDASRNFACIARSSVIRQKSWSKTIDSEALF